MNIEEEISAIKERNAGVELDKKWETSLTRNILICVLIYIVVILFGAFINRGENLFLNALVPAMGFLLSTLSLKIVRKLWIKWRFK